MNVHIDLFSDPQLLPRSCCLPCGPLDLPSVGSIVRWPLVQCRFIGGRYLLTTVTSLLLLATVTSLLGELNLTTRPGSLEKTPFNPSTETL